MANFIRADKKDLWNSVQGLLVDLGLPSLAALRELRMDCGCCFRVRDDLWATANAIESKLWLLGADWLLERRDSAEDAQDR